MFQVYETGQYCVHSWEKLTSIVSLKMCLLEDFVNTSLRKVRKWQGYMP